VFLDFVLSVLAKRLAGKRISVMADFLCPLDVKP